MVKNVFDILFYKLYRTYKKKDSIPLFSSVLFMGIIRLSILLFIGVSLDLLFNVQLPFKSKWNTLIVVALIEFPFLIWTYFRYTQKEKIKELEEKYSDKKYDIIKPWHIFMLPVFFIILMFIILLSFGDVVFLPGRN